MSWLEQEKKLAIREGVTHPENFPFQLQPQQPNGRAILLIHGFSSSPKEMRPLAEALKNAGFVVCAVRLPGHGTSPEDLAQRNAEEWLASCDEAVEYLLANYEHVSVGGLSTGALLAVMTALRYPLEKLILLSPFLRLNHILAPFAGLLSPFLPYQKKDIPVAEQPFYYQRRPLRGISQINRLRRRIAGQLPAVKAPTLVLASTGDATIAPRTAKRLFQRLGSRNKLFHCYAEQVPHVLTSPDNPEQLDVLKRCVDFLLSDPSNDQTR
jgi:carboxylesterase